MASSVEAQLSAFERMALQVGRYANETEPFKTFQYRFIRNLSFHWMRPFMARRTYVENIDWLLSAPSDQGVVFACNHRSFFDSYVYLFALYHRGAKWPRRLYFPVRSDFFYDQPLGVMINLAVGAGCMYPPIYRDKDKRALNTDALERIERFLGTPHSLVGLHPEGTRNKGDPYTLLPAQPGIGQIVLKSKPMVIPVFINGLTNDFAQSLKTSLDPRAKRVNPIIVCYGDPVDYQEYVNAKPRAALYKKCADTINQAIAKCGEREKEIRASIVSGEIASDDQHWLWHAGR